MFLAPHLFANPTPERTIKTGMEVGRNDGLYSRPPSQPPRVDPARPHFAPHWQFSPCFADSVDVYGQAPHQLQHDRQLQLGRRGFGSTQCEVGRQEEVGEYGKCHGFILRSDSLFASHYGTYWYIKTMGVR